jgi:hypothetical protein
MLNVPFDFLPFDFRLDFRPFDFRLNVPFDFRL